MDKNTVIGFLLIGAIIVAFTFLNRPTQEQLAQQQRMRDSLQQVERQKAALEAERSANGGSGESSEIKQQNSVADFFAVGQVLASD